MDNVVILNPGNSPYTYNTQINKNEAVPGVNDGDKTKNPTEEQVKPKEDTLDVHDPNGGLMSVSDKKSIIDLKCDQILKNPDEETILFGPDYPTKDVNYYTILVRCPSNCHTLKSVDVYGLSIHPAESPICLSAIVDNAASLYGGIFSISLFSGYDKYELPQNTPSEIKSIKIKPYGPSKKSYVLAKIDNVDMVEKDLRILNSKGQLSSSGRLEIRYEGVWGTVCAIDNTRFSAKILCKEIGYRDGEWKNPDNSEGKGFCKSYNEEDHCGAESQRVLFSKIACSPNDTNINQCNKVLADPNVCGHDFDSIISCFNDNYDSPTPIPNKTIRLESSKKAEDTTTGRMELYYNNKYLPVCNTGFNEHSATIACKQMGFTGGSIIIDKNLAKSYQYALGDKTEFNAIMLSCKGEEAKVSECKMILHDISCQHDQDVVLSCTGNKGDVTGKNQYILTGPIPPPKLGKLGLAERNIDCDEKGYDLKYRGDPGSIYVLNCPANCGDKPGMLWGTGVYTSDSYICKAGLHGGIIGPLGGKLLYVKAYGQKLYVGGSQNGGYLSAGIERDWPSSFSLSKVNSAWENMLNLSKSSSSFIELQSKPKLSSFIELIPNINISFLTPIFKWTPPSFTYSFTPTTQLLFEDPKIPSMKDYTILFQFVLTDFKNEDVYLFSYPGCGGFNIYITKVGTLRVGDFCNKDSLWTPGFNVPLNDKVTVYIKYKESKGQLIIKSLKVKDIYTANITKNLDINPTSNSIASIGRLGSEDSGHFLGKMNFFYIFSGEVPITIVESLIKSIVIKNINAAESFSKTIDNRMCVSRCSENPIPPNPGCGDPPKEADLNGNVESSGPKTGGDSGGDNNPKNHKDDDDKDDGKENNSNGLNGNKAGDNIGKPENGNNNSSGGNSANAVNGNTGTGSNGNSGNGNGNNNGNNGSGVIKSDTVGNSEDKGTYDNTQKDNMETIKLDCDSNLFDKQFTGTPGKFFRCHCPNCSNSNTSGVFGTEIYHPKSSICKAAQHSGALQIGQQGEVIVTLIGAKPVFNGSEGIDKTMSGTLSAADKAFTVKHANPLTKITCQESANKDKFAKGVTNTQFVVLCPENCSQNKGIVIYGTNTYTDTSSICLAAIHRGIINDRGGEVKFVMTVGKDIYKGSNGFGISSKDFGPHIRSFEFLGQAAAIYFSFKEDFQGKFEDKWTIEKHSNPIEPNSNGWDYFNDPKNTNKQGQLQPIQAIRHTGKISANNEFNYGSWAYLKNAEWANGSVKFNLMFKNTRPIAFFFRYKDKNNYYGIDINPSTPISNLKLFSRIEGKFI